MSEPESRPGIVEAPARWPGTEPLTTVAAPAPSSEAAAVEAPATSEEPVAEGSEAPPRPDRLPKIGGLGREARFGIAAVRPDEALRRIANEPS